MVFTRFVEIGRVVLINSGENKGKIAVIVDVVDANRALVSGPTLGVARHAINFKTISLTKFVIERVAPSMRDGPLERAIAKSGIAAKWADTTWSKKLASKAKRASLSDFERFQVKVQKQKRARLIRAEFNKLKKA